MRKALIDGDVFVYRAAFACDEEVESEALLAFDSLVTLALLESKCFEYQMFLTGSGNFRYNYAITAPYKGNRKNSKPPTHKDAIRAHAIKTWEAIVSEGEEADDTIAIAATKLGPLHHTIISIDKDFLQVPGVNYNPVRKEETYINELSGIFFFYQQILMGDAADNIIGVKGIGPAKSSTILTGSQNEAELYNRCLQEYNGNKDRVIENARLLWLRREEGQIWEPPV